jgi:hypothetical protein
MYVLLSTLLICPSIQPKHSASSRASLALIVSTLPFLPKTSQTPSFERAFVVSHFLNSARSLNSIRFMKFASRLLPQRG